jgi:hypothetical protein
MRQEVKLAGEKCIMSSLTTFTPHQILLVVNLKKHAVRTGETRKAYTILVRQPEGKRPFRTPSIHGDNIKMCLKET